ncbi:MAG: bifunctional methylenetetrahydrofolate dehydrogenase/methenyltetrahydrofolate cyclohydrolase FolD [Spirochaetaceae bacterium]
MSAKLIDGKAVAKSIRESLSEAVARHAEEGGGVPSLAVVLVGDDPASHAYVAAKSRACEEVGIRWRDIRLPEQVSEASLLSEVDALNRDPGVNGILVQLPLPGHIDPEKVINAIDPRKDVDGFHPENLGGLLAGKPNLVPCTPQGIVVLLQKSGVSVPGKHVVILGRSNIVGKPLAALLLLRSPGGNATVTVCHSATTDIAKYTRQGDILVVAAGRPGLVQADMIRPGAVVIDVGSNRIEDPSAKRGYRFVGDVDFEGAWEVASMITPVPGGVGPMTIAMLLKNTYQAALGRSQAQR